MMAAALRQASCTPSWTRCRTAPFHPCHCAPHAMPCTVVISASLCRSLHAPRALAHHGHSPLFVRGAIFFSSVMMPNSMHLGETCCPCPRTLAKMDKTPLQRACPKLVA